MSIGRSVVNLQPSLSPLTSGVGSVGRRLWAVRPFNASIYSVTARAMTPVMSATSGTWASSRRNKINFQSFICLKTRSFCYRFPWCWALWCNQDGKPHLFSVACYSLTGKVPDHSRLHLGQTLSAWCGILYSDRGARKAAEEFSLAVVQFSDWAFEHSLCPKCHRAGWNWSLRQEFCSRNCPVTDTMQRVDHRWESASEYQWCPCSHLGSGVKGQQGVRSSVHAEAATMR